MADQTTQESVPAATGSPARPAPAHDSHGHGSSPAAWTGVSLVMLGSLIACIAVVVLSVALFVVGVVVVAAGPVVGSVLAAMGYGSRAHSTR